MKSDTVEFWNEMWATLDHTFADHDELLAEHAGRLEPGRALDLGCGSGGNAVWLAERGWRVTAVDFSDVAVEKGRILAADREVEVDFLVSDASTYRPGGLYDLITSFYIHLWPGERAQMLANGARSLAPGGRLLFVSHDQSAPPSGWSQEDLESLTTPGEVASELHGLRIARAEVVEVAGEPVNHAPGSADGLPSQGEPRSARHPGYEPEHDGSSFGATTLILAVKDR